MGNRIGTPMAWERSSAIEVEAMKAEKYKHKGTKMQRFIKKKNGEDSNVVMSPCPKRAAQKTRSYVDI